MIYSLFNIFYKAFLWIDFIIATISLYILGFLPKFITKYFYPKLFRKWCWVFIRALGVNLKLHQKNSNPIPKQYILIGNHPSAFEDIGMPALFDVRYLAKIEVKDWYFLGRISNAAGTIYVKRENKESRKQSAKILRDAIHDGLSLGIYPEGGCKGKRIHLPFLYGIFELAIDTNTPIVPVFLHYEAQDDFVWIGETLPKKIYQISKAINKDVNYYLYDAIYPENFKTKQEMTEFVEKLYLKWQDEYLI